MGNAAVAIKKASLGDFFGDRRMRRRNRRVTPYRVGEKWLPLRQSASGPHVDYNARLYDPALGRFLSVDPMIAHPGSTQAINPYSYVLNNPLNRTDPTGEADVCSGGGNQSVCNISTKDVQSMTVNSNGSVSVTKTDGSTVTSGAGMMNAAQVATFAAGAAANSKIGPSAVNYNNLSKMIKGLDPKMTSDHTKISAQAKTANMAALSACSYSTSCTTMGDWQRQGGLFEDSHSGFQAGLYQKGNAYALAFAGTNGPHDVAATLLQWEGKDSPQFDEAVALTHQIQASLGAGASFTLTGHSLGGGLASVASLKWGVQADTFNAEGLSSGTIKRYGLQTAMLRADNLITAYHTALDPLTWGQRLDPGIRVPGRSVSLWNGLFHSGHSIKSVCGAVDVRKYGLSC